VEWEKLLSEKRIRELVEGKHTKPSPDERTEHGRDYDRAIFSTPVRRMQDKTQVFPLDPNDSVRTRLTHSLEVSNIARNMARDIGNWLLKEDEIKESRQRDSIEIIASTCGLIHDLGNPPFGHAGEDAIKEWFGKKEKNFFKCFKGLGNGEQLKNDFLKFEGNA
jgi:dGTPase